MRRPCATTSAPRPPAGTLHPGDPLLPPGAVLPSPQSTFGAETFAWGRLVYAGGNHLATGDALFTKFQPVYDPTLNWTRQVVLRSTVTDWPATTVPRSISESRSTDQVLMTSGVVWLDGKVTDLQNAIFQPVAWWTGPAPQGVAMSQGFVLSEGYVLSESTDPASGVDPNSPGEP